MRAVAYILMVVALGTLLPWLAMAPMSLMAFDSGFNPMALALVAFMLAIPVWVIGWDRQAWKAMKADNPTRSVGYALLAMVPMLSLMAVIFLGSAKH